MPSPSSGVYQTDMGLIFRVIETAEGGLRADVLKDGNWIPARVGVVGLRLAPSTTKLSPSVIENLPV